MNSWHLSRNYYGALVTTCIGKSAISRKDDVSLSLCDPAVPQGSLQREMGMESWKTKA